MPISKVSQLHLEEFIRDSCESSVFPLGGQIEATPEQKKSIEYRLGWNACVSDRIDMISRVRKFVSNLSDSDKALVLDLFAEGDGDLFLLQKESGTDFEFALNMNDTFGYACAECEFIELLDLFLLADLWIRFGSAGLTAWAARKRNEEPIAPRKTEQYLAAVEYLKVLPCL